MINLPEVTIILLTNRDFEGAKRAIDKSCESIEFGAVKIIWDEKISGIDEWNKKIIYDLPKYVDTSHALLIHQDGYVIHPKIWNPEWLKLDYIGAPFPLPKDNHSYLDDIGRLQRVGNSVSLRSKKLMHAVAQTPESYFWSFKERYGNTNEDGYICCHNRFYLERLGCKFATLEQAIYFSKEHEIPENREIETFAFHQLDT